MNEQLGILAEAKLLLRYVFNREQIQSLMVETCVAKSLVVDTCSTVSIECNMCHESPNHPHKITMLKTG